jgi:hypothetical protein
MFRIKSAIDPRVWGALEWALDRQPAFGLRQASLHKFVEIYAELLARPFVLNVSFDEIIDVLAQSEPLLLGPGRTFAVKVETLHFQTSLESLRNLEVREPPLARRAIARTPEANARLLLAACANQLVEQSARPSVIVGAHWPPKMIFKHRTCLDRIRITGEPRRPCIREFTPQIVCEYVALDSVQDHCHFLS